MNKEELLKKLKNTPDIIPDAYDGSYQLVREIIYSYSTLTDLSKVTSTDLDAIYCMALGTWKSSIDKKKEYISDTILSDVEKKRLYDLLDEVWDKACTKQYEHNEAKDKPSIGMFGTGFFRFSTTTYDSFKFIELLIKLKDTDSKEAFKMCESVFSNNIKGMGASSASIMLHCYMPDVFPIINGNMGIESIYEFLGIHLNKSKFLSTYISNCRLIEEYRNKHFSFKNYRVLDYAARLIPTETSEYWPSLEEYNPGITKEKWIELLNNNDIFSPLYKGVLAAFYKYGPSSCMSLDILFDQAKDGSFQSWTTQIAKRVHEATKCPIMKRENKESFRYWTILFVGRSPKENEIGSWIYKLRDELYDALTEVNILDYMWEETCNVWLYEPGDKALLWDEVYDQKVIKVSGRLLGDLKQYQSKEDIKDVLENEKSFVGSISNISIQSFEFANVMKPGDIIYIRKGKDKILGRGTVESDYYFDDNDIEYPHKRNIKWTHKGEWYLKLETAIIKELTLIDKVNHKDYIQKLEQLLKEEEKDIMQHFDKNIILYGPPGTGKTYHTAYYAVAIIEKKTLKEVKKEYTDKEIRDKFNQYRNDNLISFTTFHQSYGYEEFIEGIKPITNIDSGDIKYKIEPGVFKSFCDNVKSKDKNYVFIIDEINRGNISKIFGELITLIEDSKRKGKVEETSVLLPYSKEPFSVPSNVYIIGTMNTADRSIALMDTALRRRFHFVEMMPDVKVLREIGADKVEELDVALMLEKMNERITFLYDREHIIGHAFFIKLATNPTLNTLENIFKKSIIPLLQEYFYEDYQKIQLILGDNGKKDDTHKFIIDKPKTFHEIFKGSNDDLDIPNKSYKINEDAFTKIESYIEII